MDSLKKNIYTKHSMLLLSLSSFSAFVELKSRNLSSDTLKILAILYKIKLFFADDNIFDSEAIRVRATVDILSILANEPLR